MKRARVIALSAVLLAVSFAGTNARADPTTDRELVEAARAYLDPSVESTYFPRKRFLEAIRRVEDEEGIDVLRDLDVLRQIINQGRGFEPDFADRRWRKENDVLTFEEDGPFASLVSERMRFTYVKPTRYPRVRELAEIPRARPFPLLMSFHEARDLAEADGKESPFPGQSVLMRRYPRRSFPGLYEDWLLLAPAVRDARWLEPSGALRHGYSTSVLRRFWKHVHVDFDRIVIDGKEEAAALASVYPLVFAGVVLRGGDVDPGTVKNFASVPVFVVDDARLEKTLADGGHCDVTTGGEAALMAWLQARKRRVPASFDWEIQLPDHVFANWIALVGVDATDADERAALRVRRVDTAEAPNTLTIDTRGVEQVSLWLNDEVVDLDRDVRLVLNGEVLELGTLERSFSRMFELDPKIRRNMFFGWLYPTFVGPLTMGPSRAWSEDGPPIPPVPDPRPEPPGTDPDAPPTTGPEESIQLLSLDERLELQHAFLRGRPDTIDAWLRPVPERAARITDDDERLAAMAEAMYPLALRDLWWRTTSDADVVTLYQRSGDQARGLTARRLGWILGGGDGPYPEAAPGQETDGWPVLTTLVLDRLRRERMGKAGLPAESPLATRPPPDAWKDWWTRYEHDYLGWWMRRAYEGDGPETLDDELLRERADTDRLAAAVGRRNLILAVLTAVGIVLLTLVVGLRRPRRDAS